MVRYKVRNFPVNGHLELCTEDELDDYVQKLIMRLTDEEKDLRRKAAEALAEYVAAGHIGADAEPHPAAVLVQTSLSGKSRDYITSALQSLGVMGECPHWSTRFLLSSQEVTWLSGDRSRKLTRLRDIATVSISKADAPTFDPARGHAGEYRTSTSPFDSDARILEISGPVDARLHVAKLILEDLSRQHASQDNIERLIGSLTADSSGTEGISMSSSSGVADVTMKLLLPAQQFDAVVDNEWSQSTYTLEGMVEEAGIRFTIDRNGQTKAFDDQEDQGYVDEYEIEDIILRYGSRSHKLYKVVRGRVDLIDGDGELIETLCEGQSFGEPGARSTYTAKAASMDCGILATIPPDPSDVYPYHLATCVGDWSKCSDVLELLHSALEQDEEGQAPVVARHAISAIARKAAERDRDVRIYAAETVAKFGPYAGPDAAAALVKELDDDENTVVWRYVKCIAKLREAAAPHAGAVADCLFHKDPHVRREAAKGLRGMGPAAAPYATKQLAFALRPFSLHNPKKPWEGPHQDIREFAVLALMAFGESAAEFGAPALAKILTTDQYDDSLRFAAARALGAMGPAAAKYSVRQLACALEDPDELVREAAREALVSMNCSDALKGAMFVGNGHAAAAAAMGLKVEVQITPTPVEFYFENADYDKVDHDAFKTGIFSALTGLGLETSVSEQLTISLYKGSVVARIDGPAEALDTVRGLPFVDEKITIRLGLKRYEGLLRAPEPENKSSKKARGMKQRPKEASARQGPLGGAERSSRMAECLERPTTREGQSLPGSPNRKTQGL
jgi:HEAT repeat protein